MSARKLATALRRADTDPATAVRAAVNRLAMEQGMAAPWDAPVLDLPTPGSVEEIGAAHEITLGSQQETRGQQGSYYTPDPLARFLARFSLQAQGDVDPLGVLVLDPACGAGALLVFAARWLTDRLIQDRLGIEPYDALRRELLPLLAADVIYGIDIDPIAVDLTKSALWLQTDGRHPITWLDDNIIVGDALAGDEPPRLRERRPGASRPPADLAGAAP